MASDRAQLPRDLGQRYARPTLVAASAVVFAVILVTVILSPALMGLLYRADLDYTRVSDVGQAYGAASAFLATLALGIVSGTLAVQYKQLKYERLRNLQESTEELVLLAMASPEYCQCWGARVSPDHIDERLFYYCSLVIKSWTRAWELADLPESQARGFLRNFFASEVPRLFWQRYGDWHLSTKSRTRRERFMAMVNEEYLHAVKEGSPARVYEPPAMVINEPYEGAGKLNDRFSGNCDCRPRREAGDSARDL